jgi:hypothetical protein
MQYSPKYLYERPKLTIYNILKYIELFNQYNFFQTTLNIELKGETLEYSNYIKKQMDDLYY